MRALISTGLLAGAFLLAGCDVEKLTGVKQEEPLATPVPATPRPTPKPGDWMYKDYKNPLEKDKKPKR